VIHRGHIVLGQWNIGNGVGGKRGNTCRILVRLPEHKEEVVNVHVHLREITYEDAS
jgi:hypothetical protein